MQTALIEDVGFSNGGKCFLCHSSTYHLLLPLVATGPSLVCFSSQSLLEDLFYPRGNLSLFLCKVIFWFLVDIFLFYWPPFMGFYGALGECRYSDFYCARFVYFPFTHFYFKVSSLFLLLYSFEKYPFCWLNDNFSRSCLLSIGKIKENKGP